MYDIRYHLLAHQINLKEFFILPKLNLRLLLYFIILNTFEILFAFIQQTNFPKQIKNILLFILKIYENYVYFFLILLHL